MPQLRGARRDRAVSLARHTERCSRTPILRTPGPGCEPGLILWGVCAQEVGCGGGPSSGPGVWYRLEALSTRGVEEPGPPVYT
jgi:hypothetical protein